MMIDKENFKAPKAASVTFEICINNVLEEYTLNAICIIPRVGEKVILSDIFENSNGLQIKLTLHVETVEHEFSHFGEELFQHVIVRGNGWKE